jgi:6-hydroxycyclohex-1-ene-1-carbonyl-CoA dehydrogenase
MANIPSKIETWQMTEPGKLARVSLPMPEIKPGEALIEIAGCGICHTDLGYFYDGVPTVSKPPLTLGHEIAGTVIAGDAKWVGKEVIVPAVMPDNTCPICLAGRNNRCLQQKMPGNSMGTYGGFSSHIVVPAMDLCAVPKDKKGLALADLAVVADAGTSPYQAAMRADFKAGDYAIVIGATGGLGTYAVQVLAGMGAKEVIGIARDAAKLERAKQFGATFTIQNTSDKDSRAIRDEFRAYCASKGIARDIPWKVFEWSGTAAGQKLALELLSYCYTVVICGYGMQVNQYQLSRLMAFDADVLGSWGCLPKYYPDVLNMVLNGKIKVAPFVEKRPMSKIKESFEEAHKGGLTKRIILTPDF